MDLGRERDRIHLSFVSLKKIKYIICDITNNSFSSNLHLDVTVHRQTIHTTMSALTARFSAVDKHVIWVYSALAISCPRRTVFIPVFTANICAGP